MTGSQKPLRVLFLNDTSRNGGPGRTLHSILRNLDPARVHRLVVVPREGVVSELLRAGRCADDLQLLPELIENPFEPWSRQLVRDDLDASLPLQVVRASGNVLRGASALFSLRALVLREQVQAIFCNGTSANFAGAAVANMTGVPAVWHVFYTSLAKPIQGLHARLAASRGVARILCVSQATRRLFPHVPEKAQLHHDAIDLAEFEEPLAPVLRKELGWSADSVVFASQGRILPRKGYREMVRAARVALEALTPEERPRMRFAVLGDTPEDLRPDHLAECRALVQELRLQESFVFLGFRPDVRPYLRDADAVVVPSVYEDPLPRAVLEGMALGKPVLAFDVGGIGEMVDDGTSGALIKPGDVDALAAAFVRTFRDAPLRKAQGAAGRDRIARDFDSRPHARHIDQVLHEVAAGR
jgi:glycosyltransferase involved in cell wall biosynthesis